MPPGSRVKCGVRSGQVERLELMWERPWTWGIGKEGSDRILEIDCCAGSGSQMRLGHWMWDLSYIWKAMVVGWMGRVMEIHLGRPWEKDLGDMAV